MASSAMKGCASAVKWSTLRFCSSRKTLTQVSSELRRLCRYCNAQFQAIHEDIRKNLYAHG